MVKFKDIYLTNGKSYNADIRLLDAVWVSDDGRKRKLTYVEYFWNYLEKSLSQRIMKQTVRSYRDSAFLCMCFGDVGMMMLSE